MNKSSIKPIGPAKGVRGFILSEYIFRVYDSLDKSKFTDYDIRHLDLEVEIVDETSYFYKDTALIDSNILDYSPDVLGLSKE